MAVSDAGVMRRVEIDDGMIVFRRFSLVVCSGSGSIARTAVRI